MLENRRAERRRRGSANRRSPRTDRTGRGRAAARSPRVSGNRGRPALKARDRDQAVAPLPASRCATRRSRRARRRHARPPVMSGRGGGELLGEEAQRLRLISARNSSCAGAGGNRVDRAVDQLRQPRLGAADPELRGGVGPQPRARPGRPACRVPRRRTARRADRRRPDRPRRSCRRARARLGSAPAAAAPAMRRADEQGAGLGALIVRRAARSASHSQAWPATMPRGAPTRARDDARSARPVRGARREARGRGSRKRARSARRRPAPRAVRRTRHAPRACRAGWSASSKQGRSSCTSEAQCSNSIAAAAASAASGSRSPQARATASVSCGRMRWPPGNTA